METHTIDAQGKTLGRIASTVAVLLRGKSLPTFRTNVLPNVKVRVINADKLNILEKKMRGKEYARYTGYPGGLLKETLEDVIAKKGTKEAIRRAVHGMLPSNKLRKEILKNLTIIE